MTTINGRRKAGTAIVCVLLAVTGCSSMTIQTEQDKIDIVMGTYVPKGTRVQFYSWHDIQKLLGKNVHGKVFCDDWLKRDNCTIKVIRDAETLLHEICHIVDDNPYWHGSYRHHGLIGCESFNYDTLAGL